MLLAGSSFFVLISGWPASVARRRSLRMLQKRLVAFAEAMAIIFPGRRRHGRIAEFGMLLDARRNVARNVAARGLESVVEALLGNLIECGRWWRGVDHNRLRMRAAGYGEDRQKECCQSKSFLHEIFLAGFD
jgi:hypothetical protein